MNPFLPDHRFTHELPAYGSPVNGIPELTVKTTGSKTEDVKVPAVISLYQDTCVSNAAAIYADLVVLPVQQLSWGCTPPNIAGSVAVGYVPDVRLSSIIMNKEREVVSDVFVYNDVVIKTHMKIGLRVMKQMGTKISMWNTGSVVKFM